MSSNHLRPIASLGVLMVAALFLSGCLGDAPPHLKQLPAEAQALLAQKGMTQEAPIFVRIFKEESELEIWKQKDDGLFHHFKTYPICNWSGELGPKLVQGDKQAPEGFYTVRPGQMNPNSDFHLSFNLGYPNLYDAAHGRTGAHLMVHGDCRSAGCYAMTDALIEEIYILAREAFSAGQAKFHVHAFPFRLSEANMRRHRGHKWYGFWASLKDGYDAFEATKVVPSVNVCARQYLVNAEFLGHVAKPDPQQSCPPHRKLDAATVLARMAASRTQLASTEPAQASSPVTQLAAESSAESEPPVQHTAATAAETPKPLLSSAISLAAPPEAEPSAPAASAAAPERPVGIDQPWVVPTSTPAAPKGDRQTLGAAADAIDESTRLPGEAQTVQR